MKNENEIRNMPLVDRQKLVIDLKQTPASEKFYPRAQQLISFITSMKDWKEPEQIEVKNIAGHELTIDSVKIARDGTARVYPWQYAAVARFFEKVGAAAALFLILFVVAATFIVAPRTQAQSQSYVLGSSGSYNVQSVAGLNGGTNAFIGTNSFTAPTMVTNSVVVANWIITNGVVQNFPTTNILSIVTNVPGVVSVVNYDLLDLFWGYQLSAPGTSTAVMTADYSPDNVNWQLGAIAASLPAQGAAFVGTNINLSSFAPGYIRLNTIGYPSTNVLQTNVVVEVAKKTSRTGP